MAFGFAIARFGLFLREIAQAGQVPIHAVRGLGSAWFGADARGPGPRDERCRSESPGIRAHPQGADGVSSRTVVPNPILAYVLGAGSVLVAIAMAVMALATTFADLLSRSLQAHLA